MDNRDAYKKLAIMITEILLEMDCLIVFDEDRKSVKSVDSFSVNGECIQLNVERCEDEND